jgi:hypothetical protein
MAEREPTGGRPLTGEGLDLDDNLWEERENVNLRR